MLTTVGVLSKLSNSFSTRVSKQVYVGIAYPHVQIAFTSREKAPATYKSNKKVKSRLECSTPSWNSYLGVEF